MANTHVLRDELEEAFIKSLPLFNLGLHRVLNQTQLGLFLFGHRDRGFHCHWSDVTATCFVIAGAAQLLNLVWNSLTSHLTSEIYEARLQVASTYFFGT